MAAASGQRRDAAIVGIYEYPLRKVDGITALEIKAESARNALDDAGLKWGDVDGVYDAGDGGPSGSGLGIADYFGFHPSVIDTTSVGGSSYEFQASHALRDIAAGKCKVALLTYGSTAHSDARAIGTGGRVSPSPSPTGNMEDSWGMTLIANYAMVAQRHMYEYGTKPQQLAEISVATRAHAVRNPQAVRAMEDLGFVGTGEVSVEDVLDSRMIADPLHLLECCMVSDGGGAVVIASA
ncbi:MAG TPA: thiolase domain-containing protein, partial [Dehalococcoidia bacterium]